MIKTIIFDIGNVLISFQPLQYLNKIYNPTLSKQLLNIIFNSKEWIELDKGTILIKDAIASLIKKYPHYSVEITYILNNWTDMLTPINENISVLKPLKQQGYKLYLLSNFHIEAIEQMYNQYDFLNIFDGGIISGHVHIIKPNPKIYEQLLNNYNLKHDECLFIDDSIDNIISASNLGIHTIHLNNDCSLIEQLKLHDIL